MFEKGHLYKRSDLHKEYGGQRQGGIATPKDRPFLLLFTGKGGHPYGYQDGWAENGVFLFSGEGQKGNMSFKGGNKAIRDHAKNGKDLFLFEQQQKGYVRYLGCFGCGSWERHQNHDKEGRFRQTIVFHLVPIENLEDDFQNADKVPEIDHSTSLADLRKKAFAAMENGNQTTSKKEAKRRYYERCEDVRLYVLSRANGNCEACQKTAPFHRPNGLPYLEPHHIRRLSDGGLDHPQWVGAICPNCHREIHYGKRGQALNHQLEQYLKDREES